ncbi:MAG: hypothetical protein ABI988_07495 [Nitrospirota bacterium]
MKRDVERKRTLPAFSLGIGELEALWERLVVLFEDPGKVHGQIEITLPMETLKFDNLEELKRYARLRGRITNFWILFSQNSRRISIRSRSGIFSPGPPEVSASAESEAWCAGAVETVYSFLQSYKVWYHLFISAPLGWIIFMFANALSVASLFFPHDTIYRKHVLLPWLTIILALTILYVAKGRLLPSSTLRISEEEGFIRSHVGELSLIVGLIGIALTVILFFLGK